MSSVFLILRTTQESFHIYWLLQYVHALSYSRICMKDNRKRTHIIKSYRSESRLIVKLSFELTFWIQLDSKSSCSHFQLDLSRIAHIFNLMQLDSTENWVNSTQLIKNSSLMSRELNIEIFSTFTLSFCIIFLIESHEEKTWKSFDRKS